MKVQICAPETRFEILLLSLALFSMPAWSPFANAVEEARPMTKAVIEISKAEGFRLSDTAVRTLSLRFEQIRSNQELTLPRRALVQSLGIKGIYRFRKGWFKLIPIQIHSQSESQFKVNTKEIGSGDQVVVDGVALLRVSEMEAFSGGAE